MKLGVGSVSYIYQPRALFDINILKREIPNSVVNIS